MSSFIQNEKGVFVVFVALLAVPLAMMVGLAVDGSNFTRSERRVQAATDAAAYAGAVVYGSTTNATTAQTIASQIFSVNTTNVVGVGAPSFSVNTANSTMTVSANVVVPTYIMQLGGISNKTLNTSGAAQSETSGGAEVAVVIDSSQNSLHWNNKFSDFVTGLKTFATTLNSNVLMSITPIHTQIMLDSTKLNSANFVPLLSPTATDLTANSVYFPLNTTNVSLSSAPASTYAFYTNPAAFPVRQSANTSGAGTTWSSGGSGGGCGGGGGSSTGTYGGACTGGYCYPDYSYAMESIAPILPLTQNKTLLATYLTSLATWVNNWTTCSDGLFNSLIVWGWRTIDPGWSNILATNSSTSSTAYTYGSYPKAYGSSPKFLVLMVHDQNYWDAVNYIYDSSYGSSYGYIVYTSATACSSGSCAWLMTMYGAVPSDTSTTSFFSSACENYYYKTVDEFLGLNYANAANTNDTSHTSASYMTGTLSKINSTNFLNTCQNIRNAGVTIYAIIGTSTASNNGATAVTTSNNASYFAQCTGSSSRVFIEADCGSDVTTFLQTIATAVNSAAGTGSGTGGSSTTVLSALVS